MPNHSVLFFGRLVAMVAVTALVASCGSTNHARTTRSPSTRGSARNSRTATSTPPTSSAPGGPQSAQPAAVGPRLVVVIEENHSINQVIGSPNAPRINQLAKSGVLLRNFFGVTHPSLPNYIALTSGGTQGITTDCGQCRVDAPNLIDQLEAARLPWHVYAQGYPGSCSSQAQAGSYAKKHVPFLYYRSVLDRPAVCNKVVGLDQFWQDTKSGSLPSVSFVIPDLDNDMHGAGLGKDKVQIVRDADATLGRVIDGLGSSPGWPTGSRLVVTWDEGGGGKKGRTSCCGGQSNGGHVPTIVAGPGLRPGVDDVDHDHYGLLHSIEARFGLTPLGHAADPTAPVIASIVGH